MPTISTVSFGVSSDFMYSNNIVQSNKSLINGSRSSIIQKLMVVVPGRIYREYIENILQDECRRIMATCESPSQIRSSLDVTDPPDLFVVSLCDRDLYTDIIFMVNEIRQMVPRAKWILLCRRTDDVFSRQAVASGIDGLLFENSPGELLQHVVDLVLHGYHCAPAILQRAWMGVESSGTLEPVQMHQLQRVSSSADIKVRQLNGSFEARSAERDTAGDPDTKSGLTMRPPNMPTDQKIRQGVALSEREKEIMHCLMGGHSNKLIARQLHISEATVKVHVKALMRKMQVANRTQVAICALNLVRQAEQFERIEEASGVFLGERANPGIAMASC